MTKASATEESLFGGIAMWRRIADAIRLDIVGGKLARGDRLPGEISLAERFAVNRHTVRRALAARAQEGVVRGEQGGRTFVDQARRRSHPLRERTPRRARLALP